MKRCEPGSTGALCVSLVPQIFNVTFKIIMVKWMRLIANS